MDAFDPIRDTAVRRHTEFVMRGADPVWSKNSCGFARVVFQEPPEPFTTLNGTYTF
jgi:hypothetical protein